MADSSHLKTFRGNQQTILSHDIYFDDDRVECTNSRTGELILTYDASCNVYDASSNVIARSHTRDNVWYFQKEDDTIIEVNCGNDLLKAEVEFSKLYVEGLV